MKRNASNICPTCDAGDPTSVVRECDCPQADAIVTAPGPSGRAIMLDRIASLIHHATRENETSLRAAVNRVLRAADLAPLSGEEWRSL